ncbi:hypothetical protein JHK84_053279 [Glycine max]|nr:hypothetical protein JHK84_053279 [Glycine max]
MEQKLATVDALSDMVKGISNQLHQLTCKWDYASIKSWTWLQRKAAPSARYLSKSHTPTAGSILAQKPPTLDSIQESLLGSTI